MVAEQSVTGLVEALSAAGAFPIVEAKWADAPQHSHGQPSAVLIASRARRLMSLRADAVCNRHGEWTDRALLRGCSATKTPAVPSLPADAALPIERLLARLQSAMQCARFARQCCVGSISLA